MKSSLKDKDARNTLIGGLLLKFGCGGIVIWGQLSLYFFSYLRLHDKQVELSKLSLMINVAIIPVGLLMFYSTKIAEKIGYKLLIRVCSILYPLGIYLTSLMKDYYSFCFFYIAFALSSYSLSALPVLNCIWSHFQFSAGKVTGIIFFAFGISGSVYAYLGYYLINPENEAASIKYQEQGSSQEINIFQDNVSERVPHCLQILSLIYAIFAIPGAFLISFNEKKQEQTKEDKQIQLSVPKNVQNKQDHYQDIVDLEPDYYVESIIEEEQKENKSISAETQNYLNYTYKQLFNLQPFPTLYLAAVCISTYCMFLSMNLKNYGMIKIQDDQFLTLLGAINVIVSSFSTVLWGMASDKYSIRKILLYTFIVFVFVGILFPLTSNYKPLFCFFFLVIGIINSGILTVTGPALIRFFGIEVTKRLLPIKTTAMYVSIILSPIFIFLSLKFFNFDIVFALIAVASSFSIYKIYLMKEDYPLYST